jgi:hypothetical protein
MLKEKGLVGIALQTPTTENLKNIRKHFWKGLFSIILHCSIKKFPKVV